MYRLPPPLLPPAGYRIPIRGRAPEVGPLGPLASRLGYPTGRGRGRGKSKGKGRQRNRPRNANRKGAPKDVKVEEKQAEVKVKEEVTESITGTDEITEDDITDENWQVISEETEETAEVNTENYVDFHSDMVDSSSTTGFSTFSEPMLVINNEGTPATASEEVATEEPETVAKNIVIEEVAASEDTQANDESQESRNVESQESRNVDTDISVSDIEQSTLAKEQSAQKQSTPAKEQSTVANKPKVSDRPSPNITAITAPKPASPKELIKSPYESLHCEVCNVYCQQPKHMKQHLAGRRHRMNVEAQGKEYSTTKRESKREWSNSTGRQDSGSGKGKHVTEAEKKYKAYMKSAVTYPGLSDAMQELFRHREPLVGLKYAVEVGKSVDDPNPVYYCSICDEHFNSNVKLRHFTSTLHRKIVLRAEFPHKCSHLQNDVDRVDAYKAIASEVEKEVGRQVHLIRRKVVTTDAIHNDGGLPKRSDRKVKALLDLPPQVDVLGHGYKGSMLEPHDRVVRVVPPSLKREREIGTWSPPPPPKRQNLLEPHGRYAADDLGYRNFEGPPDLLSGPQPLLDAGPPRPPLLPSREELLDSRTFRQGLSGPKPLLSLDLPPIMPGSSSMGEFTAMSSFSQLLRRTLDAMDSLPVDQMIRTEEDASIALHISNSLTKALLSFRMLSTPNADRTELGSVYSMFSGSRR